jgi:hypothetical protein
VRGRRPGSARHRPGPQRSPPGPRQPRTLRPASSLLRLWHTTPPLPGQAVRVLHLLRCLPVRSPDGQRDRPALLQGGSRSPRFRGCSASLCRRRATCDLPIRVALATAVPVFTGRTRSIAGSLCSVKEFDASKSGPCGESLDSVRRPVSSEASAMILTGQLSCKGQSHPIFCRLRALHTATSRRAVRRDVFDPAWTMVVTGQDGGVTASCPSPPVPRKVRLRDAE